MRLAHIVNHGRGLGQADAEWDTDEEIAAALFVASDEAALLNGAPSRETAG